MHFCKNVNFMRLNFQFQWHFSRKALAKCCISFRMRLFFRCTASVTECKPLCFGLTKFIWWDLTFSGRSTSYPNTALLFNLHSAWKCLFGGCLQTRDSTIVCDWIFASCRWYVSRLFRRMLGINHQRKLCGCLRVARWNAWQWIPAGNGKQYLERID